MDVTVIGGGAVGLCLAEALSARGAQVSVLEAGRIGAGASAGNAGWVTPSLSLPLPAPGVLAEALPWLVRRSSPLWIRPTLEPAMLRWLAAFAGSCRRDQYTRGLRGLQLLAAGAGAAFDRLAERGARFERHREPLLYPAFDRRELATLRRVAADLAAGGAGGAIDELSADDLRRLEPALRPDVVGGTRAAGEARVRPETLTRGVRGLLEARGVGVYEHAPVGAVRREGGAWRVETPSQAQRSDAVVLANGAGAARLLRGLGVALPVVTGKGYSRTFSADAAAGAPRRAMYLESARVAISAFDGAVRISGGLGLGARRLDVSPPRLAAITSAAAAALPGWRMPVAAADWAGMRALAPDGLPYLGPLPGLDGLHVATAHAMLGITLAPLSGELLADLLLEGRDAPARRAADPARALRRQAARAAIA